jgi:hypothetical protein|tara:strand:+ start:154 stop:978 length:825 start_codon:yes stop_codon:yes gene_type:complete
MADEQTTAPEVQSEQTSEQPQQETSFLSSLPEELQKEPSLQNFTNVGDMAKTLVHSQKMVGADKIAIPSKHATEEDWKQVYTKLGLPNTAEEYNLEYTLEEGVSDQPIKNFLGEAHKLGLLPHQAQGILNFYTGLNEQTAEEMQKQAALNKVNAEQELRKEFGLQFEPMVKKANDVFKTYFANDMEHMKLADGTTLGTNPGFIKSLAKLAGQFSEDNLGSGQEESGGLSPQEADREITKIMGDQSHPYHIKEHPGHDAAVKEMADLFNAKVLAG